MSELGLHCHLVGFFRQMIELEFNLLTASFRVLVGRAICIFEAMEDNRTAEKLPFHQLRELCGLATVSFISLFR